MKSTKALRKEFGRHARELTDSIEGLSAKLLDDGMDGGLEFPDLNARIPGQEPESETSIHCDAGELLRRFLSELCSGASIEAIGQRACALDFVLNRPPGQTQATFAASLGMSKQRFGKHVAWIKRAFGLKVEGFRTPEQRERMRLAMAESHARRQASRKQKPPPRDEGFRDEKRNTGGNDAH